MSSLKKIKKPFATIMAVITCLTLMPSESMIMAAEETGTPIETETTIETVYQVTAESAGGGGIYLVGQDGLWYQNLTCHAGDQITFGTDIVPGYSVEKITVQKGLTGEEIYFAKKQDDITGAEIENLYVFSMPEDNVRITSSFIQNTTEPIITDGYTEDVLAMTSEIPVNDNSENTNNSIIEENLQNTETPVEQQDLTSSLEETSNTGSEQNAQTQNEASENHTVINEETQNEEEIQNTNTDIQEEQKNEGLPAENTQENPVATIDKPDVQNENTDTEQGNEEIPDAPKEAGRFCEMSQDEIIAFFENMDVESAKTEFDSISDIEWKEIFNAFGLTEESTEEERTEIVANIRNILERRANIYYVEEFDETAYSNLDFSSRRLLVCSADPSIFVDVSVVISELNGIYLLQFESIETTIQAYAYYSTKADIVEIDREIISINKGENEGNSEEQVMTANENPFTTYQFAMGDANGYDYDIALIDTGATGADYAISMLGNDASDYNGHGTEMLGYSELTRRL